jgi:hypothetical protein
MSISGNLNTMQLADLLQWLANGSKTGALVVTDGAVEKKIYFRSGRIFSSASTDPKEHLGHFLVSRGLISEVELSQAIAMQESNNMLLGKILTTIGAVSEPDLQQVLRLKAQESIYDLFSWEEGEFRFVDGDLPEENLIPIDLDVTAVVYEGVHRADEWRRIREVIPTLTAIPVWVGDLTDPNIEPGDRQILEKINDDRTLEEICMETHSSEFRVCRVIFEQYRKKRVKLVRPRWSTSSATAAAAAPTPDKPMGADTLAAAAQRFLDQEDYEAALRHLRAARSLEPHDREIQRAYENAEKAIREALVAEGVHLEAVPRLEVPLDEITNLNLTPQEGFILTRIDGSYNLKSLLKISPMQQVDGLLVFYRLAQAGHIELQ